MNEFDEKVNNPLTPEEPAGEVKEEPVFEIERAVEEVELAPEAAEEVIFVEAEEAVPAEAAAVPEEKPVSGRKFCTNCGEPLKPGQKFCGNCGMKFDVREIKADTEAVTAKAAADIKRKPVMFIAIAAVVVVIALIAMLGGGSSKDFSKKYSGWASESWCTIGTDGSYIQIDTNPLDLDDHFDADAFEAIQTINSDLGFNDAVEQQMLATSALMGRQTAESDDATVSWTYHPDQGLVAIYEWK